MIFFLYQNAFFCYKYFLPKRKIKYTSSEGKGQSPTPIATSADSVPSSNEADSPEVCRLLNLIVKQVIDLLFAPTYI
jgi:hypothetical protein